jgi:hypothetical protein
LSTTRDPHDAHYLHERRGLRLLVRPPVADATHMAWDGRGNLLVATDHGTIERVHPALGTRTLLSGLEAPLGIGVGPERLVVVEPGGRWDAYDLDGGPIVGGDHPFEGPVHVQFREGKVLLTGPVGAHMQMLFYDGGRKVLRIQLPPRAVGFVSGGHLGLAQSTPVGLETIYLSSGGRFAGREQTAHVLVPFEDHIVGVHAQGVRVWSLVEGLHADVELPGATAATLSADGQLVAIGTADGEVGLARLGWDGSRAEPFVVQATDEPIRTLAFSRTGRYLATGADGLMLWTWE